MKTKFIYAAVVAAICISLWACQKDNVPTDEQAATPTLPSFLYDYESIDVSNLSTVLTADTLSNPSFVSTLTQFGITNNIATLGRVLFYDPQLSINNRTACGTCHLQQFAFAEPKAVSQGFEGRLTTRNSMAIINTLFNGNLFWDSRESNAFNLVLQPVQNHIEMGMENLDILERKLAALPYYAPLFERAFGNPAPTRENIALALSQFINTMVSNTSKFDAGQRSNFANFSPLEKMGKDLFFSARTNCASCHRGQHFTVSSQEFAFDSIYGGGVGNFIGIPGPGIILPDVFVNGSRGTANIGLNMHYTDNGRGNGKFKIPSLRNVALTAPYMHDGRFESLAKVIDHYSEGIQPHTHLDENLKNADGSPRRMHLNALEKEALVAFLQTLTDQRLTTHPMYSNPFAK